MHSTLKPCWKNKAAVVVVGSSAHAAPWLPCVPCRTGELRAFARAGAEAAMAGPPTPALGLR